MVKSGNMTEIILKSLTHKIIRGADIRGKEAGIESLIYLAKITDCGNIVPELVEMGREQGLRVGGG